MKQKKIIVAIDFGSARAGYSFAFPDNDEIYLSKFEGENYQGKTLNEVILDDEGNVVEYGIKTHKFIENGKLNDKFHFFERIKMNLYNNIYTIQSVNTLKEVHLIDIISKILEYLKKHAIEEIHNASEGIKEKYDYNKETKNIRWILTVPAIWDEKNKYIMMTAAEKAGIVDNAHRNLFFALEPEAASYYCLKNQPVNKNLFEDPYIICDLGAGTGDIICHQKFLVDSIEKIVEKCTPKGGALGSDEINKIFEKRVLKVLFGEEAINLLHQKFKENQNIKNNKNNIIYSNRYLKLKKNINEFKEGLNKNYKDESYEIDCSIFFKLFPKLDIHKIINEFNKKSKPNWIIKEYGEDEDDRNIRFPYQIIYDITKQITDKIIEILFNIISEVDDVSTIFYVGGFCSSKLAVDMIRERIKLKYPHINHILPLFPEIAVIKGATLYGLSPERIKSRKAKFSLGINAYLDWDDKYLDGGIKTYDEKKNIYRCQNGFYNYISKNDDIPYDNCITRPLKMVETYDGNLGGAIILYKSEKTNPKFIDEEGVEMIGTMELKVDKSKANVDEIFFVTIEIGGTFLNVSAFHKESNTRVNMEFKY